MINIYTYDYIMDVGEDTAVSFSWDNPYFIGGNVTTPHTYSFSLPSTETNDRVFGIDRRFDMGGIRRKIAATLDYDGLRMEGNLYLLDWDGEQYSVMFEYGRPDDILQKPLNEWWQPKDLINVMDKTLIQEGGTIPPFNFYQYNNGYQQGNLEDPLPLFPTVNLGYLLKYSAMAAGYSVTHPNDFRSADNFGLVLPTMDVYASERVTLTNWSAAASGTITITNSLTLSQVGLRLVTRKMKRGFFNMNKICYTFEALRPVKITFLADSDRAVVGGKGKDFYNEMPQPPVPMAIGHSECSFDMEVGDYFTCVKATQWHPQGGGGYWDGYTGYEALLTTFFDVEELEGNVVTGQTLYLVDNLPDLSFLELLKAYCNMICGYYVYDPDTLSFDVKSRDVVAYDNVRELSDFPVVKDGTILRYIEGYGRHNGVECNSADYVTEKYKYRLTWECDNDCLDDEEQIDEIPFNEGIWRLYNGDFYARFFDVEVGDNTNEVTHNGILSVIYAATSGNQARHIETIKTKGVGATFRMITENASEVEVQVRMPLNEFMKIGDNDTFMWRTRPCYVRTGSWSGGFATLRLVSIETE